MRISFERCGLASAAALMAAAMTLAGDRAAAATATTTFNATANIVASCTATAPDLAFGTYNAATATPLTGTTTINVYCTSGTAYTLSLNAGTGTGSTFTQRYMNNGAAQMKYNLYTTAAATTVWGDGTGATATVAGTGSGVLTASQKIVYGSVANGQDLAIGNYTSLITVTVTY